MTKNGYARPEEASGSTNLRKDRFGDFAAYLADIAGHFGFTDIFPAKEPNWDWNRASQEANRYSVPEIAELVRLLYAQLQSRGLSTRILVPEAGEREALESASFVRDIMGNPAMGLRTRVRGILDTYQTNPGFQQTEYCILGPDGPGRDLIARLSLSSAAPATGFTPYLTSARAGDDTLCFIQGT
jgi:hypothetical protein